MIKTTFPSEEEQRIAEWYVLKRDIVRPNFDFRAFAKRIIYLALGLILSLLSLCALLNMNSIQPYLPNIFRELKCYSPALFNLVILLSISEIWFVISLRFLAIDLIKLYQHYADVSYRRKCKFKPTCSEYAILAIKKYGFLVGSIMTYERVAKRCKGSFYRVDYP